MIEGLGMFVWMVCVTYLVMSETVTEELNSKR